MNEDIPWVLQKSKRIVPLSTQLANQIAAGEVIERPSFAVKELLDNSIDAGAKNISLTIEKSGLKKIFRPRSGLDLHPL